MFNFLRRHQRPKLNFDELQIMQMIVQQVVLSVDGAVKIPGATKKALALQLSGELLQELGVTAPESLVDTAIEASVRLLRALDKPSQPAKPDFGFKLDLSGKPKSGN